MLGMKNPVPPRVNQCAYFGFYDDPDAGVLISYINSDGGNSDSKKNKSKNSPPFTENASKAGNVRTNTFTRKRVNTILLGGKRLVRNFKRI